MCSKDTTVMIRLTSAEKQLLKRMAHRSGLTMSVILRRMIWEAGLMQKAIDRALAKEAK